MVYQFCRQSSHSAVLLPSHGKYVGATSIPFSEYKRKRGDRIGHHWRIPNVQGRRQVRYVLIDTNYWKSFTHARLAVTMGDRGCLSLFGRKPDGDSVWRLCWGLAGVVGVEPGRLTLRQLLWMAEARGRDAWSHTSTLLAMIAYGPNGPLMRKGGVNRGPAGPKPPVRVFGQGR